MSNRDKFKKQSSASVGTPERDAPKNVCGRHSATSQELGRDRLPMGSAGSGDPGKRVVKDPSLGSRQAAS